MGLDAPYAWIQMKGLFPCRGRRVFSAHGNSRLYAYLYEKKIHLSLTDDEPYDQ